MARRLVVSERALHELKEYCHRLEGTAGWLVEALDEPRKWKEKQRWRYMAMEITSVEEEYEVSRSIKVVNESD